MWTAHRITDHQMSTMSSNEAKKNKCRNSGPLFEAETHASWSDNRYRGVVWARKSHRSQGSAPRQYSKRSYSRIVLRTTQVREACSCTLLRGFTLQMVLASCTKGLRHDSNPPKSGCQHENPRHLSIATSGGYRLSLCSLSRGQ
jgi:hypothetical protein